MELQSFETYKESILAALSDMLAGYDDIKEIKNNIKEINAYKNISSLQPVDSVIYLDERIDTTSAENAILNGDIFWEHHVAGEATRLGLGTKYLLNLKDFTPKMILVCMEHEAYKDGKEFDMTEDDLIEQMGCRPDELSDMALGTRHMKQLSYEIQNLAKKNHLDPEKVLKKQSMLIAVNEKSKQEIINDFKENDFFGFAPENIYFMVQAAFHGIHLENGELAFDTSTDSNKRLHNHGQLMMQKAHDNVIFRADEDYITADDYEEILKAHKNLVIFNIEDLSYLTNAIDLPAIENALQLGDEGYNMVMEVVSQNPIKPQKGGACFYDPKLQKNVMIESNQLKGIKNEEITHLNKNVNQYPDPGVAYEILRNKGLPISFDIKTMPDADGNKKDYIYPCPVQGDMNFMLETAFFRRKHKPILSWKSPATTPSAVKACFEQDQQVGFHE